MIDFSRIVGFEWDTGNIRKRAEKHQVNPREAEEGFIDPRLLVLVDEEHSGKEERFHAYGRSSANRLLLVSFTLRRDGSLIRVVSARDMSRKERQRYAEEA